MRIHRHLRLDRMASGLLSYQEALHVALECTSCVHQTKRPTDVAVRGDLASANTGWPEELLRRGPVEPQDVNTDPWLLVLA